MSLTVLELVLLVAAGLILLGYSVLRSARQPTPRVLPVEGVCPAEGCRYRNPPHAVYCAKCGRKLPPAS